MTTAPFEETNADKAARIARERLKPLPEIGTRVVHRAWLPKPYHLERLLPGGAWSIVREFDNRDEAIAAAQTLLNGDKVVATFAPDSHLP